MSYLYKLYFMANQRKEFSKIFDKYIDKIYRFVFLKVNSQEVAQDICSDTFLRGWQAFQSKKIDNVPAFLYQIARNLVIDHYREKGKAKIISPEYVPINDPKQNLEEKAMLMSDFNNIKAVLADIKEEYQNVIIWHYLDDLSISETAKLLNKTEEATRVLLHRALKALRERVREA